MQYIPTSLQLSKAKSESAIVRRKTLKTTAEVDACKTTLQPARELKTVVFRGHFAATSGRVWIHQDVCLDTFVHTQTHRYVY